MDSKDGFKLYIKRHSSNDKLQFYLWVIITSILNYFYGFDIDRMSKNRLKFLYGYLFIEREITIFLLVFIKEKLETFTSHIVK